MRELRVVTFGRSKSGKTQLLGQFTGAEFSELYTPTIEELVECDRSIGGQSVNLQLLDTQGLESYKLLRELYISGADAFLLVYNMVDAASLRGLDEIAQQIITNKFPGTPPMVLVGTHKDLLGNSPSNNPSHNNTVAHVKSARKGKGNPTKSENVTTYREIAKAATKLAQQLRVPHILTSAKTSENVDSVFEQIVRLQRKQSSETADSQSLHSSASIERLIRSPEEIRQRREASAKPSLKQSLLKLKASVSNFHEMRSMRSLHSLVVRSPQVKTSKSMATLKHEVVDANDEEFIADLGISQPLTLDDIPTVEAKRFDRRERCSVM